MICFTRFISQILRSSLPIIPNKKKNPCCVILYVQAPELPIEIIPSIGQEFRSSKEVYDFYNTYAKHTGFGIKRPRREKGQGTCDAYERVFASHLSLLVTDRGTR